MSKRQDGLYKRGAIWWLSSDPVTGKRLSTHCKDKGAAQLFRAERERLSADPTYAAANTATLGAWIKETAQVKKDTRSAGTQHMYGVKLGHLARVLGADTKMVDITPRAVDAYVAKRREEGAKNNTIQRELTCLMQVCKLARRAGEFVGDLAALRPVGFSAGYVPRRRWLTRPEVEVIMFRLPDFARAWLCFALCTGARFSEVQRARLEDWDPKLRIMRIRGTKTEGSFREVPILASFERYWGYALAWLETGKALDWKRASKDLPELCVSLGLPPATPNDLRRTHASWLIQSGAKNALVAKMLGHVDSKLVDRVYGQLPATELGRLLTEQTGTVSSHGVEASDTEPAENLLTAPWRNGRRRGFKSRRGETSSNDLENLTVTTGHELTCSDLSSGTDSSQRIAAASALLLLSRVLGPCGMAVAS